MIRINLLKSEQKKGTKATEPQEKPVLSQEFVEKKAKKPFEFNYNLIFLLVIIAIAALIYTQRKSTDTEKILLQAAQNEKSQLQNVVKTLNQLEQQRVLLEKKITLITQLKSRQGATVWILDALSRNIPDWVWLIETSYKGTSINVKGRAINNSLIADFLSNLENSPVFENVELKNSTQKKSGSNLYYDFSLTTRYVKPRTAASTKDLTKGENR
jgi:Tfp pilus assembly protein PilN